MRYLVSSAIIPNPGQYEYDKITEERVKEWFLGGPFNSAVGYHTTSEALHRLFGIQAPVNRIAIEMAVGDETLIAKLDRFVDPKEKGTLTTDIVMERLEFGLLLRRN